MGYSYGIPEAWWQEVLRGERQTSRPGGKTVREPPVNPGLTVPVSNESGGDKLQREKLLIVSGQVFHIREFNVGYLFCQ